MNRNSTIRQKFGICPLCSNNKEVALVSGLCPSHYWFSRRQKSMQRLQEREVKSDKSLSNLIEDLDAVFSKYIRMSYADQNGIVSCYSCGDKYHWKEVDAGHFIPRAHMYTRFSTNNVYPECQKCNRMKDGNITAFAKHLEQDHPGIVESLQEQSHIIYKYSYTELKNLISEYSQKIKELCLTIE